MEEVTNNMTDPQDYFEFVKSKKEVMTDDFLKSLHSVIERQISKAMITDQKVQARRLAYSLSILSREHELLVEGIDTYVLREYIEQFINSVEGKAVKVVDLEFYPREIPDEIFEKVRSLKERNIFDNYYVVFTDYSGKTTKEIESTVVRKDPILFGVFENRIDGIWNICDRFYFIGDWEDEYCDLTLTKMVQKMSEKGITDITTDLSLPEVTEESIRAYVNRLEEQDDNRFILGPKRADKSFFTRVRLAWRELIKK